MTQREKTKKVGTVMETHGTFFTVRFDDGTEEKVTIAGRMRKYRIRVIVGNKVEVEFDGYGGKGRIIKRL